VNPLKSPLRRVVAIAAGALIGVAGAAAVAAPAAAHHPAISGQAGCIDAEGNWTVTWTLGNSENDITAEVAEVRPDEAVSNIQPGATVPKSGEGTLTGEQTLGKDDEQAVLWVKLRWWRDGRAIEEGARAKVDQPEACPAPNPSPSEPDKPGEPEPEPSESENPGGGGGLPVTGVPAGGLAAGAGLVLALGAVLFLLARRRRVKFTA
jgi:hypothetical protein